MHYEKRKPGIWIFFEMKKELFSDKKEVNKFVIKPSFLTSHFGKKIRTKRFGLWPLPVKCDNTELLINVTKLGINKMRQDEFVSFDIIWKSSRGKIWKGLYRLFLFIIHRIESVWFIKENGSNMIKEKWFPDFQIVLVGRRTLRTQLQYSKFAQQCKLNINDKLVRYQPITKKSSLSHDTCYN